MKCNKVQSMITPFINNKLSIKELEDFLDHISSCKECREELQVYYALLTAMKQLDEDEDLSDDFNVELTKKLERAQDRIIQVKYTYLRKKTILILTMIFLAILIGLGYANKSMEFHDDIIESEFRLRVEFQENRYDHLEMLLNNYMKVLPQ